MCSASVFLSVCVYMLKVTVSAAKTDELTDIWVVDSAFKEIRTLSIVIPAKARDYVFTSVSLSICLSVCLSVCYHDN